MTTPHLRAFIAALGLAFSTATLAAALPHKAGFHAIDVPQWQRLTEAALTHHANSEQLSGSLADLSDATSPVIVSVLADKAGCDPAGVHYRLRMINSGYKATWERDPARCDVLNTKDTAARIVDDGKQILNITSSSVHIIKLK